MKKDRIYTVIFALTFFSICACSQDPIFYTISRETAPLDPIIKGSPTNIVKFEYGGVPGFFVASGKLYRYANGSWNNSCPQPGERVTALAATTKYLYAVCMTGDSKATLRRLGHEDTSWKEITDTSGSSMIQSIYADPDSPRLFAGIGSSDPYAIWHIHDDDSEMKLLPGEVKYLSGTAFLDGIHYLSTRDLIVIGGQIFRVSESSLTGTSPDIAQLDELPSGEGNKNRLIIGMIKLDDEIAEVVEDAMADPPILPQPRKPPTIIAVERSGGSFFKVESAGFTRMKFDNGDGIETGGFATGALALWANADGSRTLLVAGVQGGLYNSLTTSYTHGYVEFDLNSDGSINTASSRHNAGNLFTIVDNEQDRYTATIGKHPINHLYQAPAEIDSSKTFFAATQNAGLWSYRDRNPGGWQWNAED